MSVFSELNKYTSNSDISTLIISFSNPFCCSTNGKDIIQVMKDLVSKCNNPTIVKDWRDLYCVDLKERMYNGRFSGEFDDVDKIYFDEIELYIPSNSNLQTLIGKPRVIAYFEVSLLFDECLFDVVLDTKEKFNKTKTFINLCAQNMCRIINESLLTIENDESKTKAINGVQLATLLHTILSKYISDKQLIRKSYIPINELVKKINKVCKDSGLDEIDLDC